ncbi:MAG: sensor histidine kinase, partial [bacterium]|nr:sensor histidine kinase [bacterium]
MDREEHVTQIRIAVTDISELTALVQEKELLMREILHRTKNNMAMIVSLLTVSTDTAIHCGLILSELLSNTMKYAFPSTRSTPSAQTNAIGILLHA